jgi:hypothetical protein
MKPWNVISLVDNRFVITRLTVEEWQNMPEPNKNEKRLATVICQLPFVPTNREEQLQHAKKIAAYFDQVDIAKEAVINCTKI